MKAPEPLIVSWQGHEVRVRHDDPRLGPYTPRGAVIRSAMELASDVEGLRLYLVTALGRWSGRGRVVVWSPTRSVAWELTRLERAGAEREPRAASREPPT